jgi:hypothetical protein
MTSRHVIKMRKSHLLTKQCNSPWQAYQQSTAYLTSLSLKKKIHKAFTKSILAINILIFLLFILTLKTAVCSLSHLVQLENLSAFLSLAYVTLAYSPYHLQVRAGTLSSECTTDSFLGLTNLRTSILPLSPGRSGVKLKLECVTDSF